MANRKKTKRLKTDIRQQTKEEKVEKKEREKVLNEDIESKKVISTSKKFETAIAQLSAFVNDLQKFIGEYEALIQKYLETKNPEYTKNSGAYSERISQDLQNIFSWFEMATKVIEEDKESCQRMKKDIENENKLLKKERRAQEKQWKNLLVSNKEKEELKEPEKLGILKQKVDASNQLASINAQLITYLEAIIKEILEKDLAELEQLQKERKELKKKWKESSTSWEKLKSLLEEIFNLIVKKGEFISNLNLRNRQIINGTLKINAYIQNKEKTYSEIQKVNRLYESYLIQEQVEMNHEKHMGDIVKTL